MKIHEIDLRVSADDGLWAELPAEVFPVPSREMDADPIEGPGWGCARRHCEREATVALACHRKYTRQGNHEEVGLCAKDFAAHRDGITLLVRVSSNRCPGLS